MGMRGREECRLRIERKGIGKGRRTRRSGRHNPGEGTVPESKGGLNTGPRVLSANLSPSPEGRDLLLS